MERGTALASKLLAFSRQQELDLEVVDVNQLVRALQPLMRSAVGGGERLQLDLASEVWPCRLDRTEFDRALLNLIVNARDATPNGGEVCVATANASWRAGAGRAMLPRGDYVRVTVADDGQGMPPAVARRALEPFFTTKGESGTGLGLSQVYGFVRQVGGDLRIRSVPGAGTTVDLFFPRCAPLGRDRQPTSADSASHRGRLPTAAEARNSAFAPATPTGEALPRAAPRLLRTRDQCTPLLGRTASEAPLPRRAISSLIFSFSRLRRLRSS